jgi:hypothetical protein
MAMNLRSDRGRKGVSLRRYRPIVLLAAAILVSSCGIFDTRDSNPPGGNGGETPREIPINVDAVLANFVNALAYKDQGLYEEVHDGSFQFIADPDDRAFFAQQGEDIFEVWDLDDELAAIRLIFSASESLTVSFSERDRNVSPPVASVRLDYRFRQRVSEDSVATHKGFAEIHLIEDTSSMWSIDRWEETSTTEFPTWGRLKGNISS